MVTLGANELGLTFPRYVAERGTIFRASSLVVVVVSAGAVMP
jgi:hypothetical protein